MESSEIQSFSQVLRDNEDQWLKINMEYDIWRSMGPMVTIPVEVTHSWHWVLEQEGLNGEGNRSVEQWRGGVIKVIRSAEKVIWRLVLQKPPQI